MTKKKEIDTHTTRSQRWKIERWELIYIILLIFALGALIYTWASLEEKQATIREEYEDYIQDCRARCGGGTQWNQPINATYTISTDGPFSSPPYS